MKLLRSVFLFVPIEDSLFGVAFVATTKITFEFLLLVFLPIVTLESLLCCEGQLAGSTEQR